MGLRGALRTTCLTSACLVWVPCVCFVSACLVWVLAPRPFYHTKDRDCPPAWTKFTEVTKESILQKLVFS